MRLPWNRQHEASRNPTHGQPHIDVVDALKKMLDADRESAKLTSRQKIDASYSPEIYPDGYHDRAAAALKSLHHQPKQIYYPGSNLDVSFTKIYPDAVVIHLDSNDEPMSDLRSEGYTAITADMDTYIPKTASDVVVIFNAGHMTNDQLLKVTTHDAVVLVNNYHCAGTYMRDQCPDFEFAGAVLQQTDGVLQKDFDLTELGEMPQPGEIVWPNHSETILTFTRR